jgi:uncharacterized protein
MSRENVEIVRRALEAYDSEGLDGYLRYLNPEVEWGTTDTWIERATYRGHAGVRRYLGTMEAEFDDVRVKPVDVIDAGEQVVSSVRISGRGKGSGAPVELTLISVGWLRDGVAYRIRNYPDMAQALEAAGLEEWALSGENVEILLRASKLASGGNTPEERESFLSILDPEIEWIARGGPPDLQGRFHGIDEAREYYARWAAAWEEWDWEIEDARESGDLVVSRTWLTGRGRGSGIVLDMRIGQLWRFRDSKVVRYEAFERWEQALNAAGLEE